jgi:hypothetical protein
VKLRQAQKNRIEMEKGLEDLEENERWKTALEDRLDRKKDSGKTP